MKKQNERIFEAFSGLRDEVIEKNGLKRFLLWTGWKTRQKKRRNLLISIGSVAACLAILFPVILGLLRPDDPTTPVEPPVGGQVPIYTGMTMSNEYVATASTPAYASPATLARGNGSGNNGNHFGNDKQPIKDAAADHLGVTPSAQDDYYAAPNSDIYITVHFENPDEYEILSFRLNGVKYAVQQFLPGSDLENLIIKLNVGDVEGLQSYTITEIKYVDGESITERDVLMRGDDTIKVYVSYKEQPTATVTGETVGFDSISFGVSVTNPNNVIGADSLWAVLYDGETILQKQALTVGENTVAFNGLTTGTLYQYAIVARYNAYDGEGDVLHVLQEAMVSTAAVLTFADARLVGNTYYFRLAWHEQISDRTLLSLALYEGGTKVQDVPLDATCIENLEQNRSYRLVATYAYGEGQETIETAFETKTVYAITFVSNGGEELGTISLSLEDTLPTPVREGYTFGGWYSDANLTQKVESVPNEATLLYAWWQEELKPSALQYSNNPSGDGLIVNGVTQLGVTDAVIPSYIGGYRVTGVDGAFRGIRSLTASALNIEIWGEDLQHFTLAGDADTGSLNLNGCSALTNVTLLGHAKNMSFSDCPLLSAEGFSVGTNSPYYEMKGDCLIEKQTKCLVLGFDTSVIPTDGSVTSIGYSAFSHCENLTSITIPDSVTSIGGFAFYLCKSLETVTFSEGLLSIGSDAFMSCFKLTSVALPEGLLSIGSEAFMSCTSLTDINIPDSVTDIGTDAFYGCPLTCEHEGGVLYLGTVAMGYESGVTEVVFREGTTLISTLDGLLSVQLPASLKKIPNFGHNRTLERVVLPDGWEAIDPYMFMGCSNLREVVIPDSVKSIGRRAFHNCTSLVTETENGVSYIGKWAISVDTTLTSVTLRPDTVGIAGECFKQSAITSIDLPDGLRYISHEAFSGCTGLTEMTIPASVEYMSGNPAAFCKNVTRVTVEQGNAAYHVANGFLIETATKTVLWGYDPRELPTDGSITSVKGAFAALAARLPEITELVLPDSIVRIDTDSFFGATNLEKITLSGDLEYIGPDAFSSCRALTDIYFGGTVAEWEAVEKHTEPINNVQARWNGTCPEITVHCTDGEVVIPATMAS